MATKYLDYAGLSTLWTKLKGYFVKQEAGKGLSEKNFTEAYETKLKGLENYELKPATTSTIGGVKPGAGLQVADDGTLKVVAETLEAGSVAWENVNGRPTNVSEFTNDAKYVTESVLEGKGYQTSANVKTIVEEYGYQTATQVNNLIDAATADFLEESDVTGLIDTALEDYVTNDELDGKNYQNATQVGALIDARGYKTETEIQSLINNAQHLKRQVIDTGDKPSASEADSNTIYMVKDSSATGDNVYVEWMVINGVWEKTGDTTVDLSGYVQKTDLVAISDEEITALIV